MVVDPRVADTNGFILRNRFVVAESAPELPLIVSRAELVVAKLPAASVTICDWPGALDQLVGYTWTPLGTPARDKVTAPENPLLPTMEMLTELPLVPILRLSGVVRLVPCETSIENDA